MSMLNRRLQKGAAATEIIFSLPVILMCLGVTVYVGTMMKARLELLGAVQQLARTCSMGQSPANAAACLDQQRAEVEARLDRCNNLELEATTTVHGQRSYENIRDGLDENGLQERAVVGLNAIEVEGRCDVGVAFPLRFNEYTAFEFTINEKAVMPFRVERTNLP